MDADHVGLVLVGEERDLALRRGDPHLEALTAELHPHDVLDLRIAVHDDHLAGEHLLHGLEVAGRLQEVHQVVVGDDVVGDVGHEGGLQLAALDVLHHLGFLAADHFRGFGRRVEALSGHDPFSSVESIISAIPKMARGLILSVLSLAELQHELHGFGPTKDFDVHDLSGLVLRQEVADPVLGDGLAVEFDQDVADLQAGV
jgi:hypothetical protein